MLSTSSKKSNKTIFIRKKVLNFNRKVIWHIFTENVYEHSLYH